MQKLPTFNHGGTGSFRNWLYTILLNRHRDHLRRRSLPSAAAAVSDLPAAAEPNPLEEAEYQHLLVCRAMQLMQAEFSAKTWKACWEHVVNGLPAVEVAARLGISAGSVYVAKSRVLNRLRQELQGLLD
jgi:RNA polymerase sigma-70 factor (ECF subfamily)